MRIAVVAPSCPVLPDLPERVRALAEAHLGERAPEIVFHAQCFLSEGHFAGPDAARIDALVEVANDRHFDAVWFARGGYGACRVAEAALDRLGPEAGQKRYLGYSDAGFLLAGLYRRGIGTLAHGPLAADLNREGGRAAITRALDWLVTGEREAEAVPVPKRAAFNLTVLSQLLGTSLEPDLSGHILLIEEVAEYMYRIDRSLFHITSNPRIRTVAGLMLGRCSQIPENDPDFGKSEEEITRHWCAVSGIPYLGRADIGHDVDNKVVPFG